jgi:hypothetical protein
MRGRIGVSHTTNHMSIFAFLANLAATVLGGAILTFIFFFLKEKVFSLPDIAGMWFFEVTTNETAYKPYENMKLRYAAVIWREGAQLHGTVEKIHENSSTGKREYVGKNRTRGLLNGYIQKNYFSKDQLFVHVAEVGEMRESTNFYELRILSDRLMQGTYVSMVANQKGVVKWQRRAF